MSFESYAKKVEERWNVKSKNVASLAHQEEKNRFFLLYTAYTNKQLVWATWVLAIATIILSALTLYFQYSK